MAAKYIKDGWFRETEAMWPGQRLSLEVDKVLHEEQSEFQDILVFKSKTYGNVLILDGVIQLTERDEHAYQEMIAHIPIFSHPNPKRVCIIGGGDGGVLREVCRHDGVEKVVMCEIDRKVCDVSKKYFKDTVALSFDDPRVELLHEDGAKYLEESENYFDVIIVDSSDPVGPAETLFELAFFKKAFGALDPEHGVLCTQGECIWLHLSLIQQVMESCGRLFPSVNYAYTTIPTYPSGQIGFIVSSRSKNAVLSEPHRPVPAKLQSSLKYYSSDVHKAAFVLPVFAEQVVAPVRKQGKKMFASLLNKQPNLALAAGAAAVGFTAAYFMFGKK